MFYLDVLEAPDLESPYRNRLVLWLCLHLGLGAAMGLVLLLTSACTRRRPRPPRWRTSRRFLASCRTSRLRPPWLWGSPRSRSRGHRLSCQRCCP